MFRELYVLLNQIKFYAVSFRFLLPEFKSIGQATNKTLISLTTSPERLKKGIYATFSTFHPDCHKVLNLPLLYRNTDAYDPNDIIEIEKVPNLKVNWIENDYGPQTKLLGALKYPGIYDFENLIVIDDDTVYSKHLIEKYELVFSESIKAVYSPGYKTIFGIRVQEGWKSYGFKINDLLAYKKEILELTEKYSSLNLSCKFHDDVVFGAVFEDLNFDHKNVTLSLPQQLLIGYSKDALHINETGISKHAKCTKAIIESRAKDENAP